MYIDNIWIIWTLTFLICIFQARASFENEALDSHNKYRSKHGCPSLSLDSGLNSDCKSYAKELADLDTLKHSEGPYGENLCYTSSDPVSCVKDWYNEEKDYDYGKAQYSPSTGHFTQLIWKSSKTLGIGTYTNSKGISFVVARYKPQGNMAGEFKENVPKPNRSRSLHEHAKYLIYTSVILIICGHISQGLNHF
ncbi:Golgi-associated plant pathogenesis-related protein 1 isoform X2 [Drosophila nasuta]|uniref:Golgi-associated plant pathogenesis-related protein 1 isoform X2 n=1 Tax=Drosophila nasuta TaxID=42062 RepID=UPI00295E904A|nr:Golgi-associated plant pathogenesis-related protein 1 isoform X2 [Drosophila nasuta]